jgi:hypothetical protein
MAMEFAITALVQSTRADDSWQPGGSRSFLLSGPQAILWCAPLGHGLEQHCGLR